MEKGQLVKQAFSSMAHKCCYIMFVCVNGVSMYFRIYNNNMWCQCNKCIENRCHYIAHRQFNMINNFSRPNFHSVQHVDRGSVNWIDIFQRFTLNQIILQCVNNATRGTAKRHQADSNTLQKKRQPTKPLIQIVGHKNDFHMWKPLCSKCCIMPLWNFIAQQLALNFIFGRLHTGVAALAEFSEFRHSVNLECNRNYIVISSP